MGCGYRPSITTASLRAVVSAVNRPDRAAAPADAGTGVRRTWLRSRLGDPQDCWRALGCRSVC